MRSEVVFTSEEYAELVRIGEGLVRVAGEMHALFHRDPFPGPDEIAHAYGLGRAEMLVAGENIERLTRNAAIVYNEDLLDGFAQCLDGQHFYNPEKLPDWATDKERCAECQSGNMSKGKEDRIEE